MTFLEQVRLLVLKITHRVLLEERHLFLETAHRAPLEENPLNNKINDYNFNLIYY
jgi:hypothetical protein